MSVLIIANKYPYPPRDGSSIAILSSLRMWHQTGHDVHLFSLNPKKSEVPEDELPEDLTGKINTHTFSLNTDVTAAGAFSNLIGNRPYHISRFLKKEIARDLQELSRRIDFDFVQWEGPFMGEYLPWVEGAPRHLMRAHNIEHRIWMRVAANSRNLLHKRYLRLQAKRLKRFEDAFANQMDGILPITDVDADYLNEHCETVPHCVILPGVDVKQYPMWKESGPHAVSLASFDWEPNREGMSWFLKAVSPLLPSDIKGEIAGRQIPSSWSPLTNWTLHGAVDDAHNFLLKGNVQFIPLLSGSGIRIKIVEAMCMGMPVVATSIAAEGSGLTPNYHYLQANTPEAFAKSLNALMKDPTLRSKLSKRAREFAEQHYDLSAIAKKLNAFVKSL